MTNYEKELDALQRFIKKTAGVPSYKPNGKDTPPKMSRPVIIWESPVRQKDRYTGAGVYVNKVKQYGKLHASSLDQMNEKQDLLITGISDQDNIIPIMDTDGETLIGRLRAVDFFFDTSDTLDARFYVAYDVSYEKNGNRPVVPGATKLVTRTNVHF